LGIISPQEFETFLEYARTVKYTKIGALASFFHFLNPFRSKKNFEQKRHCASIFVRYENFFKYFKTTGDNLFYKYESLHPEAINHYLQNNFDLKVIKVKKRRLCL
jgi:hypothetical protein